MTHAILVSLGAAVTLLQGQQGTTLPEKPEECFAIVKQGDRFFLQGKYSVAEGLIRRGISCEERLLPAGHPELANGYDKLSELARRRGGFEEAEKFLRTALAIWSLQPESHVQEVVHGYCRMAQILYDQKRYYEAEPVARMAKVLAESTSGANGEDVAIALNTLGLLHAAVKDRDGAERELRKALAIQRSAGRRNLHTADILYNLATIVLNLGFPAEAEKLYRESLELQEKLVGEGHPRQRRLLEGYAKAVRRNGRKAEAAQLMRRARSLSIAATAKGEY